MDRRKFLTSGLALPLVSFPAVAAPPPKARLHPAVRSVLDVVFHFRNGAATEYNQTIGYYDAERLSEYDCMELYRLMMNGVPCVPTLTPKWPADLKPRGWDLVCPPFGNEHIDLLFQTQSRGVGVYHFAPLGDVFGLSHLGSVKIAAMLDGKPSEARVEPVLLQTQQHGDRVVSLARFRLLDALLE